MPQMDEWRQVGRRIIADNQIMLEKAENWKSIEEYMRKIMTTKQKDEREEEQENVRMRRQFTSDEETGTQDPN